MSRVTLRERFFPLHHPGEVEGFLAGFSWCVIFKAGTSDRTVDAWLAAQQVLEPRVDVAVGFVRLPEDRRSASGSRRSPGSGAPQSAAILFHEGTARGSLDENAIVPDQLAPLLREHLPVDVGPAVRNEAVVTLEPYRALLTRFLEGELPEERFQWGYLDRLAKEAIWRDDETFALLNGLFENEWGRDVRPARLVAVEFQGSWRVSS